VWDIEKGAALFTTGGASNIIQSLDWNYNGSLLCSNSKDKKVRVMDPRQQSIAAEGNSHVGVKGGRALWLGKHEKVVTVGFGSGASREYMIWDVRDMSAPILKANLDNAAGVIIPFYDEDADLLFFAGKGDGAIRYYEVVPDAEPNEMIFEVSAYRTNESTAGCGAVYRRHCNVSVNEIIRLYQVTGTQLRPLSFQVPRKSDLFQPDLYPDCRGDEPNLELSAWVGGQNATPKLVNLENGFTASEKKEKTISKVEADKELSPTENKAKVEELTRRVAFLEAELAKRDARIKELGGQ
jgi:coronin-1B/1C/6